MAGLGGVLAPKHCAARSAARRAGRGGLGSSAAGVLKNNNKKTVTNGKGMMRSTKWDFSAAEELFEESSRSRDPTLEPKWTDRAHTDRSYPSFKVGAVHSVLHFSLPIYFALAKERVIRRYGFESNCEANKLKLPSIKHFDLRVSPRVCISDPKSGLSLPNVDILQGKRDYLRM